MYQLHLPLKFKIKKEEVQSSVPHRLRNVINPWQTEREIKTQAKSAEKILNKVPKDKHSEWLEVNSPDRNWNV